MRYLVTDSLTLANPIWASSSRHKAWSFSANLLFADASPLASSRSLAACSVAVFASCLAESCWCWLIKNGQQNKEQVYKATVTHYFNGVSYSLEQLAHQIVFSLLLSSYRVKPRLDSLHVDLGGLVYVSMMLNPSY